MPNNKIIDLDRLSRFKDKLDIELDKKANVDGNYPTMTVGSADNLTPYGENSGASDTTPFVFQSSGGSSDIGSQAYLRALRGNSVAFSQNALSLNSNKWTTQSAYGTLSNATETSVLYTRNQTEQTGNVALILQAISGGYGSIAGHKYLIKATITPSATFNFRAYIGTYGNVYNPTANVKNYFAEIITANSNGYLQFISENNGHLPLGGTVLFENVQLFDLTLMFGAGNEPTTVAEFNALFPKPYYPYNAGTLLSCKSNGYKTVGYNAFDGQWLLGNFNYDTQTTNCKSKNYIKVVPGQKYTLEIPSDVSITKYIREYDENLNLVLDRGNVGKGNSIEFIATDQTHYIRFMCFRNNYDFTNNFPQNACLHLTWDESRTGFEPYESETYALPNVELRSAGSVYDELKPDGTLIRRVGSYTFTGNETWNAGTGGYGWALFSFVQNNGAMPNTSNNLVPNLKFGLYETTKPNDITGQTVNKAITYNASGSLLVRDTSITSASAMASAMAGKTILFELATPTEEQTEYTFAETTPIDDYGTQEFLYDSDIDIPIPQGNEFFYPVDYKAFIDSLGGRDDIEYAADQVVSQTQLTQALSTFLSSISGYDATKTQTLKNVSGVLQWVDD